MANVKIAVSNVLDTVVASSNAVCDTINLVGKSATYGNRWMDSVLNKQKTQIAVDQVIFEQTYRAVKAQELTSIQVQIKQWAEKDPSTEALYKESLAKIDEAITSSQK